MTFDTPFIQFLKQKFIGYQHAKKFFKDYFIDVKMSPFVACIQFCWKLALTSLNSEILLLSKRKET